MSSTLLTLHPDPSKQGARIDATRYAAMKQALLTVIPKGKDGVPFAALPSLVAPELPTPVFVGASIPWYVTTVKLDLEARGLIQRVPGAKPQRVRRTR